MLLNDVIPTQLWLSSNTAQKMKFSIKDFFSRYDQIRSFLRIWSHLLKKSVIENFIFLHWKSLWPDPNNWISLNLYSFTDKVWTITEFCIDTAFFCLRQGRGRNIWPRIELLF